MKKHLVITVALSLFPSLSFAADDMLAVAMKRIEELEAKNKALSIEVNSLKRKKPHQLASNQNKEKIKSQSLKSSELKVQTTPSYSELSLAGFYAGINGGYGGGDVTRVKDLYSLPILNGSSPINTYSTDVTTSRYGGALAGIQFGYNYIANNSLLIGGLVDIDWSDISNNQNTYGGLYTASFGNVYQTSGNRDGLRWFGSARTRLGFNYGQCLAFLSGGLTYATAASYSRSDNRNASANGWYGSIGESSTSKISLGWTIGAGIEYLINNNISVVTEYLYTNISPSSQKGHAINATSQPFVSLLSSNNYSNQLGFHQVRVGFNYHFNAGEEKVVAKY